MILQLILISTLSTPSKHIKCTNEEWKCHNKKQCISYLNFCDFILDCDDGSDEMECKDCYDKDKDCTKWVDNGSCLKPDKFIFENCRMSCEICKTSTTTTSATVNSSYVNSSYVNSSIFETEPKINNYHKIIESEGHKNNNKLDKFNIVIIIFGSIIIILFIILIIRKKKTNVVYIEKTNRREVVSQTNNEEVILNQEYDNIVIGEKYITNRNEDYLIPGIGINSMDEYYSEIE